MARRRFSFPIALLVIVLLPGCRTPWRPFGGTVPRNGDNQTTQRVEILPPLDPGTEKPIDGGTGPQFPAPQLTLAVKAPPTAQRGSPVRYVLTVRNDGNATANDLAAVVKFDAGLSFRDRAERMIRTPLKPLAAGASTTLEVLLDAKSEGRRLAQFALTSGGKEIVWKEITVSVVARRYDLSVVVPPLRTLGSRVEATIAVSNTSSADIRNAVVSVAVDPKSFKPLTGSRGVKIADGRVTWQLPMLQAGHSAQFQLECECTAVKSAACIQVEVTAANAPGDSRIGCLRVTEAGRPFDMRIADKDDLLRVGDETEVIVSVQNRSGIRATSPELRLIVPAAFAVKETSVWEGDKEVTVKTTVDKQTVTFPAVPLVDADGVLTYRLKVRARDAGRGQFRASLMRDGKVALELVEPFTVNAK